jgi:hypothetical protein
MRAASPEQPRPRPEGSLAGGKSEPDDAPIEPPSEHRDVTTIMNLLGDIKDDVHTIRRLLEEGDDDGAEETPEGDA